MKNRLAALFVLLSLHASATHLRSGYISVQRLNASGFTVQITITVFTDAGSPVLFGGEQDVLDFGDGTSMLVPETSNTARPDLGPDVAIASFTVLHTYPGNGAYIVSYLEPNRNEGVVNMDNSVNTTFYIETMIHIDPLLGVYNTPEFLTEPVFSAKLGTDLFLSLGAVSSEDYIVRYELTIPNREKGTNVTNYILPEDFAINPFNGMITWNTQIHEGYYYAGEYAFAVEISLAKMINGFAYGLCRMVCDFQIILEDTDKGGIISDDVELDENSRLYIPANESQQIKIFYETFTTPASEVELNAYSQLDTIPEAFSFTSYDSSTNENIKVGVLTLTNDPAIVRDNPYLITVRGKDNPFASDLVYLFYTKDLHPEIITGTEEEVRANELIEIFPNPVTEFMTISLAENQIARFVLYDHTGKAIIHQTLTETTTLDVRLLPPGFYFSHIQTGTTYQRVKLIKN